MSSSYRKHKLISEAVSHYRKVKASKSSWWPGKLSEVFCAANWKVDHPGAEKFVAFKGPLVVKWNGRCSWDMQDAPIRGEMHLYRTLKKLGYKKNVPKVYLYLGDFIIEQRLDRGYIKYRDIDNFVLKINENLFPFGSEVLDICCNNTTLHRGKLKVYDGKVVKLGCY